jgi:predicted aspartyl protease
MISRASRFGKITLSILLATTLGPGEMVAADRADARPSTESTPQFEALPLTRSRQNHLLVRAHINGKPALLLVDSGAPATLISLKRREHFGLSGIPGTSELPAGVMINGAFNKLAIVRSLRLGALDLVDVPVVVANVDGPRRAARIFLGQEIDGILGVDVLFATKAVLDCQEQVLILNMYPRIPGKVPGLDFRGFRKIPIYVSEGFNLYVDSAINGAQARLLVDTGAVVTTLHRSFVRQMRIPLHETPFRSSGVNLKEAHVEVARIRRLSVGSVNIAAEAIGVSDLGWLLQKADLPQRSRPFAGLLGAEILQSHHGIIDFGTRTLYLKR